MKFFDDVTTKAELKQRYRVLCKELHPDSGGDQEQFLLMQREFEELQTVLKHRPDFFRVKARVSAERQMIQNRPPMPTNGRLSKQEQRFRNAGKAFAIASGAYVGAIIGDVIFGTQESETQ